MSEDLDLLIIGAGCAGLSLAIQLANLGADAPKTRLIERRSTYQNDRTWCFWGNDQTPFADLACQKWNQFSVRNQDAQALVDCAATPYRLLAAKDFYHFAQQVIERNNQLALQTGVDLLEPARFEDGKWILNTSAGRLTAKNVVDTRPTAPAEQDGTGLWQSFCGYEVQCEAEIFDPESALLMDFLPPCEEQIAFNYLLPFSKTRALIEYTTFSRQPGNRPRLESSVISSVERYVGDQPYKIVRIEEGLIPMGMIKNRPLQPGVQEFPGYVRVGVTSGAARPATGYAFQRIQSWARDCANALQQHGHPVSHRSDGIILQTMDKIFLRVLREQPRLAPDLFFALFSGVDSARLIRFLSDTPGILDFGAVVRALPVTPFLKAIFVRPFRS